MFIYYSCLFEPRFIFSKKLMFIVDMALTWLVPEEIFCILSFPDALKIPFQSISRVCWLPIFNVTESETGFNLFNQIDIMLGKM